LKRAYQLAEAEKTECLHVIRVYTTFDEARAGRRGAAPKNGPGPRTFEEEETALEEFVLSAGHTAVPVEARCIRSNTGFAASDFVQSIGADLLIVPAETNDQQRLPNRIAWITDVIPCNLWVIR
jgi:hypothetical protein